MLASTYRVGLGAGTESAIDYVAGKIAEENTENSMAQNAFNYFVPNKRSPASPKPGTI